MKKLAFFLPGLFATAILCAQNYSFNMGEEIKLKKGTQDLDVIAADNTGLYFLEARTRMKYNPLGVRYGKAYKLYKLDKNFGEVFEKDYKKELKDVIFHSFQTLGDDLYMFAIDYQNKGKLAKVFGAKVDKSSGDLAAKFSELGSFELESAKDNLEMKMTAVNNGNSFLMVSNISGKERFSMGVTVLDKNFTKKESAIINLPISPARFSLQDVKLTANNKIVLLAKEYDEVEVQLKKKKGSRLVFKQYIMSIYSTKGVKEKDILMETGDRYIINGTLIEQPGGAMLLAGFYSNSIKKDGLNGFFFYKVNIQKGALETSSFKPISADMLGKNFVEEASDADDETKENKKQFASAQSEEGEEQIPNEFEIRSVNINPVDNSIIITSEISKHTYYMSSESSRSSGTYQVTYYDNHQYITKDILVVNADKEGNIRWINDIPKLQEEGIRLSTETGYYHASLLFGFFSGAAALPYYSSHTSFLFTNKLVILMNDHASNNVNPEYGDKVRSIYNFRKKSNTYGISIDLETGKMIRKFIASNNDETVLMPRHSFIVKNEVFLPSWRLRTLAKTKLRFAKIIVK